MASLIDSLINIMNDENRQYTELLDLSNYKTTAIVKGDVGQLQEIFGKEQKLIDILNRLEMERQSCVADICKILHLSAAEVFSKSLALFFSTVFFHTNVYLFAFDSIFNTALN